MDCFFARQEVGASASASPERGIRAMRRLKTMMAAVVVATAVTGTTTAKAGLLTPAVTELDYTGYCNSSAGCPQPSPGSPAGWTVFDVFTLDQGATISEIGFYSYLVSATAVGRLTAADYASTNLSIWQAVGGAPGTSVAPIEISGVDSATLEGSDVLLATVDGINLHLNAGAYFIGFQNNFDSSKGFSTYATTSQPSTVYYGQSTPAFTSSNFEQVAFYINGTYDTNNSGGPPPPPPPDVPEPSTWAMTLVGFAGMGWLARRGIRPHRLPRYESA